MISVSDSNPVLFEIILTVSENYPKMYCNAHFFPVSGAILSLAEHDWLKE